MIPHILSGGDVVAMARTGSGKTAAFLSPMACRLAEIASQDLVRGGRRVSGVRGLVVVPTRELALQTFLFFKKYAKFTSLSACLIAGGEPIEAQFAALATNPEVAVATPGRLLQIMDEIPKFSLRSVCCLVLDEADRLFEGNLAPVVMELIRRLEQTRGTDPTSPSKPHTRQIVLLSATMPAALAEFASTGLSAGHSLVRLDAERFLSPTLWAGFYYVQRSEKLAGLLFLLKEVSVSPPHRQVGS